MELRFSLPLYSLLSSRLLSSHELVLHTSLLPLTVLSSWLKLQYFKIKKKSYVSFVCQ